MKKIFSTLLVAVILCFAATSCGRTQTEKEAIDMTTAQLVENFNKAAKKTDFRLEKTTENDDGTFEIETADSSVVLSGTISDGKMTSLEVESSGLFEPTLPTYDYMVYTMMACDDTVEFDGADSFIADLYYEAYYGGEEVIAGYNGLQYAFQKTQDNYWFRIRNTEEEKG